MAVVVNTFAFNPSNFDFMEIRRVADEGPGCMLLFIKTSSPGGGKVNLSLNCDSQDEAIKIYLDVITQLAVAESRPVSIEFLAALSLSLQKSTTLPLGEAQSVNPDSRGDPPAGATRGEGEAPANAPKPPSIDKRSYPIPPKSKSYNHTCHECGNSFYSVHKRSATCWVCSQKVETRSIEELSDLRADVERKQSEAGSAKRSSKEAQGTGGESDSQRSGEPGHEHESTDIISGIPLPDQTGEDSSQGTAQERSSDSEGD